MGTTYSTGHLGLNVTDLARSFEVPTIDDVRAAHEASSESGGIFFADPDGIRLEICAPTGAGVRPAPHSHAPTCGFF